MLSLVAPWFGREVILWVVGMAAFGAPLATCTPILLLMVCRKWAVPVKGGAWSEAFFPWGFGFAYGTGEPGFYVVSFLIVAGCVVLIGIIFYLVKAREYTRMPQVALDRLILGGKEKSRQ